MLAAESAFALQNGITDGVLVARLREGSEKLEQSLATLARASAVSEFLERLCEETALLATFGLRIDGPGRVESLRLLVEAADSLADAGLDTLPDFTRWLAQQESTLFGQAEQVVVP